MHPLCLFMLLVALLWPAPASAEPISTAIGLTTLITSLGVSAAVAGTIGGAIIGVGLSVGLNLLTNALGAKPQDAVASTPTGVQATLRVGAAVPRNFIAGKQATAGQLVYWNLSGDNNAVLSLVFALAAGPHDFFGMYANGKRCTLGSPGGDGAQPILDFDHDVPGVGVLHFAFVNFHHGFYDQAADTGLIGNASPAGRWTSNHRGRGVCYVNVTLNYLPELFPQGIPQFLFEIGSRLYDPRKDDTAGGAGAHRWSDQATWEASENVALAAYLYERGLTINGIKQVGRGLAPVDLVTELFVAAANVCDEAVALKAGGTEPRYRIAMNVGADRDFVSVEQDLCTAMGGWLMDTAGAVGPIAGAARPVAFTFTRKDLISGRPLTFSPKRSRSELVNGIYGVYSDPAQNWQAVPYPARRSSADVTADGEEFAAKHDYLMISSGTQAQRVGEIERQLSRHQATAGVTLGFRFSNAEQGDWCTWTDSPVGSITFQITRYQLDAGQCITLSLRQISSAVFDWDEDVQELDPQNPGDLPGIGTLIGTVPDFSATAVQLNGPGGLKHPGIRCLWSPILDRTVDRVRVQYRLVAQPDDISDGGPFPPEDGDGILSASVQAAGAYEVRATIDTTPLRIVTWTEWVPVTAAPLHVVPQALEALSASAQLRAFYRDVNNRILAIEDFVGTLVGEQEAQNRLDLLTTARQSAERDETVAVELEGVTASVTETAQTVVALEGAFASLETEVTATFLEQQAQIATNTTAISDLDGSFADLETSVTASVDGLSASVTINATAIATVNGRLAAFYGVTVDVNGHIASMQLASDGSFAAIKFKADAFLFALSGYSEVGLTIGTLNGSPAIGWGGNILLDGVITANKIVAGEVNTSALAINGVDFNRILAGAVGQRASYSTSAGNGTIVSASFSVLSASRPIRAQLNIGNVVNVTGTTYPNGVPPQWELKFYLDGALQHTISISANTVSGGQWAYLDGVQLFYDYAPMSTGSHTFRVDATGSGYSINLPAGRLIIDEMAK